MPHPVTPLIKKAFYGAAALAAAMAAPAQAQDQTAAAADAVEQTAPPTENTAIRLASYTPPPVVVTLPAPATAPVMVQKPPPPEEKDAVQNDIFRDTYETVAGKTYLVRADVHRAFADAKLPKDALIATCARESSCDPGAENPRSKACGLFQLMTDERTATLYEAVYNYGAQYGYEEEAAMVRRELLGYFKDGEPKYGYYPITPAAKKHLVEKCFDPVFSTKMHEGYTYPKVLAFKEEFGRDMTYGDLAGMNNWGDKGWKMIVEKVEEDAATGKTTPATTFFAQKRNIFGPVAANVSMFRDRKGRALSITQAYRNLVAHGGETIIELKNDTVDAMKRMVGTIHIPDMKIDVVPSLRGLSLPALGFHR